MTEEIRLLIVDDHPIVRKGLHDLMELRPEIKIVAEACDGVEAVLLAKKHHPDVILMDLLMPNKDGIEATREIKACLPETRILVLTSFSDDDKVFPAIKAGALGYLLKDSSPQEVIQAIHDVYKGESHLHPTIARKLIRELNTPPANMPPTEEPLTEREWEIARLVAQGLSTGEISGQLSITERTVCTHVSNILSKLHLANRTQVALFVLKGNKN